MKSELKRRLATNINFLARLNALVGPELNAPAYTSFIKLLIIFRQIKIDNTKNYNSEPLYQLIDQNNLLNPHIFTKNKTFDN